MIGRSVVTVYVADVARAAKFYVEVLGFKRRGPASEAWAEVDGPGVTLGLHRAREHGPKPNAIHLAGSFGALRRFFRKLLILIFTARGYRRSVRRSGSTKRRIFSRMRSSF